MCFRMNGKQNLTPGYFINSIGHWLNNLFVSIYTINFHTNVILVSHGIIYTIQRLVASEKNFYQTLKKRLQIKLMKHINSGQNHTRGKSGKNYKITNIYEHIISQNEALSTFFVRVQMLQEDYSAALHLLLPIPLLQIHRSYAKDQDHCPNACLIKVQRRR